MQRRYIVRREVFAAIMGLIVFGLGYLTHFIITANDPARGFKLPTGDVEAGLVVYRELGCYACHTVKGVDNAGKPTQPASLVVPLGGKHAVVTTYGELVTAIIHHAESIRPHLREAYLDSEGDILMPDYTRHMTTRELIDLVAFLEAHYKVVIPEYPKNYYPYGFDYMP